jgi:two-component system chemotaxis response regulator CheY
VSYRVAIVDDSATQRSMVRKAIGMAGLPVSEVLEAANGREALELMRRDWVDLVFADINMPEMTGVEMVEHMARDGLLRSVPVVIVSSNRNEAQIDALLARGVRAYVQKPFRPEAFREIVERLLGPTGERP